MRRYDKEIIQAGKKLDNKAKGIELKKGAKKRKLRKEKERKAVPRRYNIYVKTHFWKDRRNKYFQFNGRKCEICRSIRYVQLHHLVYRSKDYGSEPDTDLIALCRGCHNGFHLAFLGTRNMRKNTLKYLVQRREEFGLTLNLSSKLEAKFL